MPAPAPHPRHSPAQLRRRAETRALGFARVRSVSNWITAGAALGAVAIVGLVSHEIPGRSSAHPASGATTGSSGTGTSAGAGSGATSGVQDPASQSSGGSTGQPAPPSVAPTPIQRAPVAVSGGSGW
ncbi:MAG TPA: hypothetical protein VMU14_16885 [Acidimicrobiales bacterium]|nr:hypothetical protein [Acidimicrobiales bacterium]